MKRDILMRAAVVSFVMTALAFLTWFGQAVQNLDQLTRAIPAWQIWDAWWATVGLTILTTLLFTIAVE